MHPSPPKSPNDPLGRLPNSPLRRPGAGRPTPAEANAALFANNQAHVAEAPEVASRRSERGKRIMGDVRRALLFLLVLVFVGFVLYEFVSVTAL